MITHNNYDYIMKNRTIFYSIQAAIRGLVYAFTHEKNFRREVCIAPIVCVLLFILGGGWYEFGVLWIWIVIVLFAEVVNTAIERVVDILKPHKHPYARVIKDLSAAFVFLSCVGAGIAGVLIFVPLIVQFIM